MQEFRKASVRLRNSDITRPYDQTCWRHLLTVVLYVAPKWRWAQMFVVVLRTTGGNWLYSHEAQQTPKSWQQDLHRWSKCSSLSFQSWRSYPNLQRSSALNQTYCPNAQPIFNFLPLPPLHTLWMIFESKNSPLVISIHTINVQKTFTSSPKSGNY